MNTKELILIILAILIGCSIIAGAIYFSPNDVASNENNDTDKNITNNATNSTNTTNTTQEEQYSQSESYTPKEDTSSYKESQSSYQNGKSQSSQESNDLNYDSELNLYYDNNGMVVDPDGEHPQGVGLSYDYMSSHNCGEE